MGTPRGSESFRGLLLRHRRRTGLTQRDLAALVGVSLRSVQDWEGGLTFPTAERLKALTGALLNAAGLAAGRESLEARELWTAAQREGPRMHAPFDDEWFVGLLAARASPLSPSAMKTHTARAPLSESGVAERIQDWGEAPDTAGFVGRTGELALVQKWLLEERCRLVAVLGMGGIGKTSLAACVAQRVASSFERVYWRSLRNAPPVSDWLAGAIGFLSDQHQIPPPNESERINALLQLLRARRCLLVLDNSEVLFEPGQREGRYSAGMDGYGQLFLYVGEASHQSCLVLTSREAPPELARLAGGVRGLELHGLGVAEAQALLADKRLIGDTQAWISLVERYGGNGLALKIVSETIRQVYDGDVGAFLEDASATYGAVFGGIRRLLDAQAERLSRVERDVLTWMAVEREPISLADLSAGMKRTIDQSTVIEVIETLRRRSLVEPAGHGVTFTLQSMVLEYVTDRLVETVAGEIERGEPVVLVEQPLIKAQAREYVRQTQERLIGTAILAQLNAQHTESGTEPRLLAMLDAWRGQPTVEQGYGPGNVANLLRLLRGNLRATDLSRLVLRQVYLQGVDTQDASLAGASLTGTVLDEPFAYPTSVALSADGAFLVAGTPSGEVRLWRAADRTLLVAERRHTGMVWSVAVSADGQRLASGGDDGTVRLWSFDVSTSSGHVVSGEGEHLVATLEGHVGPVWGVALSGDGRLLASGGEDGKVRLWDAGTRQVVALLEGHDGGIRSVAVSADGQRVATGGDDGTVRLWSAASARLLATLQGHSGPVFGVALSAKGRVVASGGTDGTVRLWTESGELQASLEAHPGGLRGVAVSGDGRVVASGGGDGLVRLWETESGQLRATLPGHTGPVWDMALSEDGRLVASGSWDGTVRLWDADNRQVLATVQGHTGTILSVALTGDGRVVASGDVDGLVRLWETDGGQSTGTLRGHSGVVRGVALSGEGRLVASGGSDGTVRLWDARAGQPMATLPGHSGAVWCVAVSGDGRLIASGGVDATVRLWDAGNRHLLATLEGSTSLIWGVALSADGRLVACAGVDGTVTLWDTAGGQLLKTLRGHTGLVYGVALSGDGQLLASGGADEMVRLWDTGNGELLATLRGHSGVVSTVALSRDGQLLASGGDDGIVRVWDTRSRACLRRLRSDRHYQRLDITGLTGVTTAQRAALLALGAIESPTPSAAPALAG